MVSASLSPNVQLECFWKLYANRENAKIKPAKVCMIFAPVRPVDASHGRAATQAFPLSVVPLIFLSSIVPVKERE